ncbi:MAG: hypothetical protein KDC85_13965 [Saprospiraceae bacterium]|nr:hypothetical protein [Saprospiraceae bacterium]MCB9324893.1 glycosyltransferase [Lewinellaceae bacterium]
MKKLPAKILVSPLDWGLGHATRCIPIIETFIENGTEVLIAGNGNSLELLKKEFPNLTYFQLPGYHIHYFSNNMFINILLQLPKLFIGVVGEYFAIQKIIRNHSIELLISDNRFGCFSKKVKSVFITHQVNIQIPFTPLKFLVNFLNRSLISQFDECWVPDSPSIRLSGKLSEPKNLENVRFIGLLSRMKKISIKEKWDLVVVLSGPEPQRTRFEKMILEQVIPLKINTIIIQGIVEKRVQKSVSEHVKIISYCTTRELNEVMSAAKIILCRSGYSILMDLVMLQKKAILVPTPGQTEQEYLAEYLFEKGIFYRQTQKNLDIKIALAEAEHFCGFDGMSAKNKFRIL